MIKDNQAVDSQAKILMVDDEPTTLEVMEMFLRAAGYTEILRNSESRKTEAVMLEERPDLLLLNLVMPQMDGEEVLRKVRANPELRETPVVIVTGTSDAAIKEKVMAEGVTDFLRKPIDPSELILRVRNTLASRKAGVPQPVPEHRADPPTETPLISSLLGGGDGSGQIVAAFVVRLQDRLTLMDECLLEARFEELVDHAHWLKGAAGTVGFNAFTEPAETLHGLAREGKREEVRSALEGIWRLADRIVVNPDGRN